MNVLPQTKQVAILKALTEGSSVRATARMVGVSKDTVLKLLVQVGQFCELYQDHRLKNLPCKRVEADEIWAFVSKKQRRARAAGEGDCWTFTAICADSKLMVSWLVGERSPENATIFMTDVASRLANRVQLTTDGHRMYWGAVSEAFHYDVDYAMLVKKYVQFSGAGRYSPGVCVGTEKHPIIGRPDPKLVSTSYVERSNLDLRMRSRRFTRLTNGFSKKEENHAHAVALHFMTYNFCRSHGKLTKDAKGVHTTPAMAAGLTDHVWKIEEILDLMNPNRTIDA